MFDRRAQAVCIALVAWLMLPAPSWADNAPYPADEDAAARAVLTQAAASLETYRLSPGDVLEVLFHDTGQPGAFDYRIALGDELQVDFAYHPDFSRALTVRTDGRITVPRREDVMAYGRTPTELAAAIVAAYRGLLRDPVVTVTVKKGRPPLAELKEAIDPLARGQSKRTIVAPDGRITLPLLAPTLSAGRPLDEVAAEVNRAYAARFPSLRVSLLLESVAPNRVFVFGEVRSPGAMPMTGPITVLQAVALAGGALETGSLADVRILDWDENRKPRLRTVDLDRSTGDPGKAADLWLPPNATVYLPPTTIARYGRMIDQVVRRLFLFNGFNIGVSYELRRNTQ